MTDSSPVLRKLLKELLELTETLLISMFAVSLVFTYILGISSVEGDSMEATLTDGDRLLISRVYTSPEPGDIAVIEVNKAVLLNGRVPVSSAGIRKVIVKRIIAVGGQELDIDFERGAVYVDGVMLDEEYVTRGLTHMDSGAFTGRYPITIPEGYVFVMGDNRNVSKDSRSKDIGLIPADCLYGKVLLRIYPFDGFGKV